MEDTLKVLKKTLHTWNILYQDISIQNRCVSYRVCASQLHVGVYCEASKDDDSRVNNMLEMAFGSKRGSSCTKS